MQVKTGKELKEVLQDKFIERQFQDLAGQDCYAVVYGKTVHTIGVNCEFENYQDFISHALAADPDYFLKIGQFTDLEDCLKYLFENIDNEDEMHSFLRDFFDGRDMSEYEG